MATIALLGGLMVLPARAEGQRVELAAWAESVCTTVTPASDRAAQVLDANVLPSGTPSSPSEALDRVRTLKRVVGAMSDMLAAMRDGIANAGVPKIAHGRRVIRQVVGDLDGVVDSFDAVQRSFARYADKAATDPTGALADVQDATSELLSGASFHRLAEDMPPRLTQAMSESPTCRSAVRALEDVTASV